MGCPVWREGGPAILVLKRFGARVLGHMPPMARLYAHMAGDPLSFLGTAPLKEQTIHYRLPFQPLLLVNEPELAARILADETAQPAPALTALMKPLTDGWAGETTLLSAMETAQALPHVEAEAHSRLQGFITQWLARKSAPAPIGQDLYQLVLESLLCALLDTPVKPEITRRFAALQARAMQQAQLLPLLLAQDSAQARASMVRGLGLGKTGADLRALVQVHILPTLQKSARKGPFSDPGQTDAALDQIIALLLFTTEGVASTVGWLAYELARDQLLQEGAALALGYAPVLGGAADARFEGHPAESVMQALISETLRLHPPFGLFLRVSQNLNAQPAGTLAAISPRTLHRHHAFWAKPDSFSPERWLDGGMEAGKEGQPPAVTPAAFIPFGLATRPYALTAPAGVDLTLALISQLLRGLLSSTRLHLAGGPEPRALSHLSCRPEPDVVLRVLPRPAA